MAQRADYANCRSFGWENNETLVFKYYLAFYTVNSVELEQAFRRWAVKLNSRGRNAKKKT